MKPDPHNPPARVPTEQYNREHPLLANPGETQIMQHLPQLDGVRAIAVLLVIWHHFVPATLAGGKPVAPWGAIGVGLFFVLSGFLITRILLNCRLKIESNEATTGLMLKQFYMRRFLRIFPLYYGVLLLLAIFNPTNVRERIWWHLGYLSNVRFSYWPRGEAIEAHLWSLSVEEQFYIFWPLIIFLVPRKLLLPLIVLAVVGAPVFRVMTYQPGLIAHEWMMPGCLDLLGGGALLALLSLPQFGWSRWWNGFVELCGVVGVPLFLLYVTTMSIGLYGTRGGTEQISFFGVQMPADVGRRDWASVGRSLWSGHVAYTLTAVASIWLIGTAARGFKGPLGWFLQCAPMVYIGRISYGLYVIHMFVPYLLTWAFPSYGFDKYRTWETLLIFLFTSIALASLSWYAYEAPLNKLKRYFEYEKKG